MEPPRNTQLDELGHNKINFKHHLTLYLVINAIFWTVWYMSGSGYMWPIWPMALGSIGMAFHYMLAWGE